MGNPLKKLAGETAIYGLSTILARILNFFFVPLYTRLLSTAHYGTVTEFMSYIAILQVVLSLGLETGCFRFANTHKNPSKVFSSALATVGTLSVLLLGICGFFGGEIAQGLGYEGYGNVVCYVGLILAIDNITAILFARLRFAHKALRFAVFKTLKISAELLGNLGLFFLLPAYFQAHPESWLLHFLSPVPDFGYVIMAILLSCLLSLLLFLPELLARGAFSIDKALWKQMMRYALPLMLAGLPGILNDLSDRILFRFFSPEGTVWRAELGVFQAGVKLAVLMNLFIQMFRFAAEPFFFAQARQKEGPALYAQVMGYLSAFCALIFLGVMLYMDVIGLLIGPNFREGLAVVPIMLLAYLLLGLNFQVSMWYKLADKTTAAIYVTCIGLGVTLLVNIFFMPRFGYMAAAWAHLLSYASILLLNIFLGRRYYPVPYPWGRVLVYVLGAVGVWGLSALLPEMVLGWKLLVHTLFMGAYSLLLFWHCRRIWLA
jgi:Membrane protein involved in the export of O-antigen and teichoic acid